MTGKRLLALLSLLAALCACAQNAVTLVQDGMKTTMKNGLIEVVIGSDGRISTLKANGQNVVGSNSFYFDYTASAAGLKGEPLRPSKVEVIRHTDDYAEVLYSNTTADLRFQQGFIVRSGVKGVYMYVVANGTPTSDKIVLQEARVCGRLNSVFLDGYVDDRMRGRIPSNAEMATAEKEENTIQDATYRLADGSVYTKYNWGQYIVRDSLHGLMHTSGLIGVWNIPCATEWYPGGPMKQELTVHATSKSPITIQMLQGEHFGTSPQTFADGERKLYGPFLVYVNYSSARDKQQLVDDAKQMAHRQMDEWPFEWFDHELYPHDRATVTGRINVTTGQTADSIQVLLAQPGSEPYTQGKGYMFWALTGSDGRFSIPHVRKGDYMLYAYATKGDVTDELQVADVHVDADQKDLGTIDWTPRRYAAKLFQIGQNNRMADGFCLSDTLRNYGLWELVPASLTFTVGQSNESTDWYYGQVKNGTWNVRFDSQQTFAGTAHLTISAAASTNSPRLAVAVNGTSVGTWAPTPNDGSIYRSAVLSGHHHMNVFSFPASLLRKGTNTVSLTMSGIGRNGGIMYDCIKLEAGQQVVNGIGAQTSANKNTGRTVIYTPGGTVLGCFDTDSPMSVPLSKGLYLYRRGTETGKFVK